MVPATKSALEELLRQRRLAPEEPPLRGERRRGPLSTGLSELDARTGGGLPRGQLSEAFGPASSGRTGLALATVARVTGTGGLAAWVDPCDRLDPTSAAASGVALERLLWLRGAPGEKAAAAEATRAVATLLGSGLFDVVVLDLAGVPSRELRRMPATTWVRLQRIVEAGDAALLLLASGHIAKGPNGVSLAFEPKGARFEGSRAGRMLMSLRAEVRPGPLALRGASLELSAFAEHEPRSCGDHEGAMPARNRGGTGETGGEADREKGRTRTTATTPGIGAKSPRASTPYSKAESKQQLVHATPIRCFGDNGG